MTNDYLERILKARVYEIAIESPLEAAVRLSRRETGCQQQRPAAQALPLIFRLGCIGCGGVGHRAVA
jgi:hypothetical protein